MKKGTFSLVARDEKTGRIAVAGASHWFGYGTLVPFAQAGIGAVATQAECNTSFGSEGLKLLESGKSANEALNILINDDANRSVRQLLIIDSNGETAAFTGESCVKFASDYASHNFAVAGNMLDNKEVIAKMVDYYESSTEEFEDKILSTLKAGQSAGGDVRGKRSLAMIIMEPEAQGKIELDTFVNIRIDDHADPFSEAERLLKRVKAYKFMNLGDVALFEHNDKIKAVEHYAKAQKLDTDNIEVRFWYGKMLVDTGEVEKGQKMLDELFAEDSRWKEFWERVKQML